MSDTSAPPVFTIGEVLSTSIAVTLRRFLSFFALTIIFGIGLIALVAIGTTFVFVDAGIGANPESADPGGGSVVIVLALVAIGYGLYFWLVGAVAYGVVQDLRGRSAGPIAMLRASLPRAHILLGAGILSYLAMGIGFVLLVIPGLIIAVGLAVVAPVAAVERRGVVDSMRRSWDLTRGYRWHIFGLFLMLYVVLFVVSIAASLLAALIGAAFGDMAGGIIQVIVELGLQGAYVVLMVAAASVAYHTLRQVKEGVTSDEIAAVFD